MAKFNKRNYFERYYLSLALSTIKDYKVGTRKNKYQKRMIENLQNIFFQKNNTKQTKTIETLSKWTTTFS